MTQRLHDSSRPSIALIGGGTRSGKSAFALQLARERGRRRTFIATAQPFDDEMRARISAHAAERGADFSTVEEAVDLPGAISALPPADVLVIDCITLWLSNLLLAELPQARIGQQIDALCDVLRQRRLPTILVTNEVGMGVVPESALGRTFRDLAGVANQRLSALADELYWAMLGSILRLRPEPLRAVPARSP